MRLPTIGILGGIGSGKSSVVRHVTDFQLQIIDADRIGHDVLSDPDVLRQLSQSFPPTVFDTGGQVIRSALAQLVFGDTAAQQAARDQLEQIVHPAIRREITAQIQSVSSDFDAIILDAAVLLESGWVDVCDHLIYIDTPQDIRIERVKTNRGWSAEELERRESSQLPLTTKRQRADFVVDNSGTIEAAAAQMTQILQKILTN